MEAEPKCRGKARQLSVIWRYCGWVYLVGCSTASPAVVQQVPDLQLQTPLISGTLKLGFGVGHPPSL